MPFNIIRIPGHANLVSDQTNDVLDIVSGPGIVISTNAAIDTITISALGAGLSGLGYTGSLGFTGSQGVTGYVGSQGITGNVGYTGSSGATGYVGSVGESGYTGSKGNTGGLGDIGYTGSSGVEGYTGSQGITGFTGSSGIQGLTGYSGSLGIQGDIGYTGSAITGFTGSAAPNYAQDTGEPLGFVERTASQISFDNITRTFSISPASTSYEIYCRGTKYTISNTRTVTIPDLTGLYYIYFDTTGTLQYKTTFFDWPNDCMTAYVYWNASVGAASFVADERHGITLDWQTHEYLHRTRGAAYASGFQATNYLLNQDGSSDTHMQLDIANGVFFDEDLQIDIVHSASPTANTWEQDLQGPARIPVLYRSGTAWVLNSVTDFAIKAGTALPQYNLNTGGNWSTVDIDNNKYGVTFILATNNINYPVLGIIGQESHSNEASALAIDFTSLDTTGFPVVEFRPLYKLVYECKNSYSNTVNARLVAIQDLRGASVLTITASSVSGAGYTGSVGFTGSAAVNSIYFLEAYASETYTLPGSFTEDLCRYSIVSSNVNVSSSWFNTSTYTFTPQKAGYWEITASYDVYRNAEASMVIKKNTNIVASAGSFNAVAQQITKIVYLNGSTDYINIYNYGGVALSRSQYAERSWFQARWVGE